MIDPPVFVRDRPLKVGDSIYLKGRHLYVNALISSRTGHGKSCRVELSPVFGSPTWAVDASYSHLLDCPYASFADGIGGAR